MFSKKLMLTLSALILATHPIQAQAVKVVATNADLASMARQIAGSYAEVSLIVPPTMNPHSMPLRPSLIQKMREADVFFTIGLDHEPWLQDALTASGNGSIQSGGPGYVDCSVGIKLINIPTGTVDRSRGDLHVFGNTHYWGDPVRGKLVVVHVLHALTKRLPDKTEELRGRARAMLSELDRKIVGWRSRMARYARTPVVLYHQSWNYLMQFLDLDVVGYVEMRPGIEPSPSHIDKLQDLMKQRGAKYIFTEPYFNVRQAESIAASVGARVVTLPASTPEDKSYVEWMEGLIDTIDSALKGGAN